MHIFSAVSLIVDILKKSYCPVVESVIGSNWPFDNNWLFVDVKIPWDLDSLDYNCSVCCKEFAFFMWLHEKLHNYFIGVLIRILNVL